MVMAVIIIRSNHYRVQPQNWKEVGVDCELSHPHTHKTYFQKYKKNISLSFKVSFKTSSHTQI